MTTTVTKTFSAASSSTVGRYAKGEVITATFVPSAAVATVQFERALTPDESAWERVAGPFSSANGNTTVNYVTRDDDTRLRWTATAYTSGTPSVTIADGVRSEVIARDKDGVAVLTLTDNELVVGRGLRVTTTLGGGAAVAISASVALTASANSGVSNVVGVSAAVTITLPAATGSGDFYPVKYLVKPSASSNIVQVANSTDIIVGSLSAGNVSSNALNVWTAGATDDTITLNRTTTGDAGNGQWLEFEDIASGKWAVRGLILQTGSVATPFSSAV